MSKPTIPEVIDRFRAYQRQWPAWHSLHVVLDDGNYADVFVEGCIETAERWGDHEGAELARILLRMSRTQRRKIARTVDEWAPRSAREEEPSPLPDGYLDALVRGYTAALAEALAPVPVEDDDGLVEELMRLRDEEIARRATTIPDALRIDREVW